jgi:hypothetical protein
LISYATRDALRNLKTTNAEFWVELTGGQELDDNQLLPKSDETIPEDVKPDASLEDNDADDSDLSIQTLINVMIKNDLPAGVGTRKSGALTSIVEAENVDIPLEPDERENDVESQVREKQKEDGVVEGPPHQENVIFLTALIWSYNDLVPYMGLKISLMV